MLGNNICCYADTELLGNMHTWNYDGITGNVYTYDGRKSGFDAVTATASTSTSTPTDPSNP